MGKDPATFPENTMNNSASDDKAKEPIKPAHSRKCRDLVWTLLFLTFWAGMFAIAGVAINKGDLNRLTYGQDALGNWCNAKNTNTSDFNLAVDTVGKKYLYYFYPLNGGSLNLDNVFSVCISQCPTTVGEAICMYNVTTPTDTVALGELVNAGQCTISVPSTSVLNRCVPTFIVDATSSSLSAAYNGTTIVVNGTSFWNNVFYTEFSGRATAIKIFQDLALSWKWILVGAAVAVGLAFVWLVLIQYVGGWILLICILCALGLLAGCAAYCIVHSQWISSAGSSWTDLGFNTLGSLSANQTVLLVLGIVCASVGLLLLILILFLWKRIRLAIVVVGQASKAMRSMPFIIFLPFWKSIFISLLCAWVLYIWALCTTSGKEIGSSGSAVVNGVTLSFSKVSFQPDTVLMGFMIYYLFGLLWTYNLVVAICQCTVAGAISVWYWTRDRGKGLHFVVWRSFYYCFRYHFGSLVLGALFIAIVQFIRCILAYLQEHAQKTHNKVAKYIFCCLQCFCGCVEFLLKYINRNVYVEIAVTGYSYCKSARKAFALITSNFIRLFVINNVVDLFVFLGKLGVASVSAIVTLKLVQNEFSQAVSTYVVPTFLSFFIAYFIATAFFSVLNLATTTIFICFCEDCNMNDGSPEKPYFMPDPLRQFTKISSKAKDIESKGSSTQAPAGSSEMSEKLIAANLGNMR